MELSIDAILSASGWLGIMIWFIHTNICICINNYVCMYNLSVTSLMGMLFVR